MRIHRVALATASTLLAMLLVASSADAVQVSPSAGNGLAGQTVDISINTSSLTGLGVRSLQLDLAYNPSVITVTDVVEAGNLVGVAGWGDAEFHITTNNANSATLNLSAAGNAALTGSGAMLRVRFLVNPALLNGSNSSLILSNLIFNEGTPNDTTTNANFSVGVTPQIAINQNTAEVIRGQTTAFTVSGTVANPVSWFTTNPAIASINATGVLTGVAPGTVRVYAVDNAGRRDTTDGFILVRGMGISVTNSTFVNGQTGTLPINVTTLTGLGIRSGQFKLSYNSALVTAISVATPAGTLLNGWGPTVFHSGLGNCTVDFVGSSDLNGAGVLCYITFQATGSNSGGTGIIFDQALFNESLEAKPTSGSLTVQALPSITVYPDVVSLLAGQTQQFTLSGTPTAPISWSVVDPTIATISSTGLLTAVKGGVTQVRAIDALGSTDLTTSLTVFDFKVTLSTVKAPPGAKVRISLNADRLVGSLAIQSMQYIVSWSGANITGAKALASGLAGIWDPQNVVDLNLNPSIRVAAAGVAPLDNSGTEVHALEFTLSPTAPLGTVIPLTLSQLLFNEGSPVVTTFNGSIQVSVSSDAPAAGTLALALAPCEPNPMQGLGRVRFSLPVALAGGERVRLTVHGLDGRRVRTLLDDRLGAGEHEARWDGRDDAGHLLATGLYFTRLEWRGRALSRKLTLTR